MTGWWIGLIVAFPVGARILFVALDHQIRKDERR